MNGSFQRDRKKWRIDWRQVSLLYTRELRAALRDKSVLVNSILIPLLLYPFLLWAAVSVLLLIRGQAEQSVSRVAVQRWPEEHPRLRRILEQNEEIRIVMAPPWAGTEHENATMNSQPKLDSREVDALLEFRAHPTGFRGSAQVIIIYDKSRERSAIARARLTEVLDRYRESWVKREAQKRGIDTASWQVFTIRTQNLASGEQMSAFVLGLMLPVIFAVMVATGCFYPAVDTLAGERERGTWETLISTAAHRSAILMAKYLHVVTFGGLAGLLNLLAVLVTIKPIMRSLAEGSEHMFDIYVPWLAMPLLLLVALLLAGFIAAGMMVFAAFARTFKEGQSMITPFYIVLMVPIVFLQVPGLQLSLAIACLPVVNIVLVLRAALSGTFDWLPIGLAVFSSLVTIGATLAFAAWILHFEEVATGAFGGTLSQFLRSRLFARAKFKKGTR